MKHPTVTFETSKGTITLELYQDKAPKTVENFLQYVKDGHYDKTIFHRVIDGFMVQGGGFTEDFNQKATRTPVENEATNGLKNEIGTVAMARTSDPHSASAQFFINTAQNDFLNNSGTLPHQFGYCVFGKVTDGMDVVQTMGKMATGSHGPHQDVPKETIVITKATVNE